MSIASTMPKALSRDSARVLRRRRILVIGAVAGLHIALIWLLQRGSAPGAAMQNPRTVLVFVEPAAARLLPKPSPQPFPPSRASRRQPATPTPQLGHASKSSPIPQPPEMATVTSASPSQAPAPDTPDPGRASAPRLMIDAKTIQNAAREVAGSTSFEHSALPVERRPGGDARLQAGIGAAAHGDCLKGDFRGSNMGLLSLPMLAIAAAEGRCGSR